MSLLEFRSFRNHDVPVIAELWNSAELGRGAVIMHGTDELDFFVLSQPHFDRHGLILAFVDGQPAGFVHAGFGVGSNRTTVDSTTGVICALVVHPAFRGRGIGGHWFNRRKVIFFRTVPRFYWRGRQTLSILTGVVCMVAAKPLDFWNQMFLLSRFLHPSVIAHRA